MRAMDLVFAEPGSARMWLKWLMSQPGHRRDYSVFLKALCPMDVEQVVIKAGLAVARYAPTPAERGRNLFKFVEAMERNSQLTKEARVNPRLAENYAAAVAMSPKSASTEFLLPRLMRKDINNPIVRRTERGAETHHRHRGQYDCDGGGAGGAIGHRSRRQESVVRNVAAAKQTAHGDNKTLSIDDFSSVEPSDLPAEITVTPPVSDTSIHTTTHSDTDDETDQQIEFPDNVNEQDWGGSDLKSLIFGESYTQELVSANSHAGESEPLPVPTNRLNEGLKS